MHPSSGSPNNPSTSRQSPTRRDEYRQATGLDPGNCKSPANSRDNTVIPPARPKSRQVLPLCLFYTRLRRVSPRKIALCANPFCEIGTFFNEIGISRWKKGSSLGSNHAHQPGIAKVDGDFPPRPCPSTPSLAYHPGADRPDRTRQIPAILPKSR